MDKNLQELQRAAKKYGAEVYVNEEGVISLICSTPEEADDIFKKVERDTDVITWVLVRKKG